MRKGVNDCRALRTMRSLRWRNFRRCSVQIPANAYLRRRARITLSRTTMALDQFSVCVAGVQRRELDARIREGADAVETWIRLSLRSFRRNSQALVLCCDGRR